MALPKRKISKQRRGKRRSQISLSLPTLVRCPHCAALKQPHCLCPECQRKGKSP